MELQAWISDRTPQEQDQYLFVQRKKVPDILNRIIEYQFRSNNVSEGSSSVSFPGTIFNPFKLSLLSAVLSLAIFNFHRPLKVRFQS